MLPCESKACASRSVSVVSSAECVLSSGASLLLGRQTPDLGSGSTTRLKGADLWLVDRSCIRVLTLILKSEGVLKRLSVLFVHRGVKTLFIRAASPLENGYVESFKGKRRDELLAREQFDGLREAE